jgi:rhodanese-related sulfurtransferase
MPTDAPAAQAHDQTASRSSEQVEAAASLTDVGPRTLRAWLDAGDTVLIDVREPFEHAEQRIAGARLEPLGSIDAGALREEHAGKRIVFHCKAGGRSAKAACTFAAPGETVFHLAGGIDAWAAEGLPTLKAAGAPRIGVMRQVQIAAGSMVALGTALGVLLSPWFLALPAFVGCGLVFAGVSGWCGMAKLLAVMPWNKGFSGASCAAPASGN